MKQCYLIINWDISGGSLTDGPFETRETALGIAQDLLDNGQIDGHVAVIGPIGFELVQDPME